MQEAILLFEITDDEMKQALRSALLPLHVKLQTVDPGDYGKRLGTIAGMSEEDLAAAAQTASPDAERPGATTPNDGGDAVLPDAGHASASGSENTSLSSDVSITAPMLVFVNLRQSLFDRVLAALREHHVSIPTKAVLTPTNCLWSPAQLFAEIQSERAAIAAAQQAKKTANETGAQTNRPSSSGRE